MSPSSYKSSQPPKQQRQRSKRPMAVTTGRSHKRIPKRVVVELTLPDALEFKEAVIAQNVSARGMRVAAERVWRSGDSVLVSSPEGGMPTQARVVYCQRLENNKFAVGLEISAPLGAWAKPY